MPFVASKALKFQRKIKGSRVTKEQVSLFMSACTTFFKVMPFDLKSLPLCSGGGFSLFPGYIHRVL
jgi:hypothetical protein